MKNKFENSLTCNQKLLFKKINVCFVFCSIFLLINLVSLTVFSNGNININLNLAESSSINSSILSSISDTSSLLQLSSQKSNQGKIFSNFVSISNSSSTVNSTNYQNNSQNNPNLTLILSPNNILPINYSTSANFQPNIITNSTNLVINTIRTGGFSGFFLILAIFILGFSPIFLVNRFKRSKIQIINRKKSKSKN